MIKYLKDKMGTAVRAYDMDVPREARKYTGFKKSRIYQYDSDDKTITTAKGRWIQATKAEYDKFIKDGLK